MKIVFLKSDRKAYRNGPRYYFYAEDDKGYKVVIETQNGWFREVKLLREKLSELNLNLKVEKYYGHYYVQFKNKEDEAFFLLWASSGIEI